MIREKRPNGRRDAGFSFIELLVTIIIAGIAFAAIVPLFVSANQKNAADLFRQAALNAAQDRIEKIRALDYQAITEANLNLSTYAGGVFGTTAPVTGGASGASRLTITYTVTPMPSAANAQYKIVTVSVTWTPPPAPVKTVTLQTIVYRQYAGPTIASFWTDPGIAEDATLGDKNTTTVTVNAIPTQPWLGTSTNSVQFTIWDQGGNVVKSQAVYNPNIAANAGKNPANCGLDATNAFWWEWDSTGAVDGTYSVTATAAGTTYQGPTERFYFILSRGNVTAVPTGLVVTPGANKANLTWTAVPNAVSYKVYRSTSLGGPWTLVGSPTAAALTDSVAPGTYWYQVSSVSIGGDESGTCAPVSTTVVPTSDSTPPTKPPWVSITADVASPGVIELTWGPSTDSGSGMLDYRIWWSNSSAAAWGTSAWTAFAPWTNLTTLVYDDTVGSGVTRYYCITARDALLNESTPTIPADVRGATTAVSMAKWTLTVTNTNSGASKNRYVWIQNMGNTQYYSTTGSPSSNPQAGTQVLAKNGTALFNNLPNATYNIWVSQTSTFSSAKVQTSAVINNANVGASIN